MNETQYLTGPCQHCGNAIEFTSDQIDTTATCPHCGNETILTPAATENEPGVTATATTQQSRAPLITAIIITILLVAAGATAFLLKQKNSNSATSTAATNSAPAATPVAADTTSTNKPPKALGDLKVGEIKLEKTKGSSLVYAVGTLKNDSDYQRFGVRIELDLFDKRGTNVGIAKDYINVIEPHQDWQFRALAPDSKTTRAQLATIKEDE